MAHLSFIKFVGRQKYLLYKPEYAIPSIDNLTEEECYVSKGKVVPVLN
jgi:hypothetical protein